MLRGLPFSNCSVCGPGTPVALVRAPVLLEVPAPRVPPRSPASLYDACVPMSGVRDAQGAMLIQVDTR